MKPTTDLRTFLGWDAPALPRAAALLAAAYARADVLELDRVIVVLPGARAARRLEELLVDEAAQRGLRLVPPQVTTVGDLHEQLYQATPPLIDSAVARRLWLRRLRALPAADLALLFPQPPAADDLRGWLGLAGEVMRLHGMVAGAGHRFSDVVACCESGLLADDSARWSMLARLQDGYAQDLAALGRSDRHLARLAAIDRHEIGCAHDVWLVGVAELPMVVRRMLLELARRDHQRVRALVHAPAERADAFDALGCVLPAAWLSVQVPLCDEQLLVVDHPSHQARAAVGVLASFAGQYAAEDIVIGLPDPEVVPYLEQQLAAAGVRARFAAGLPIERTSAYRLLAALADLLHDGSFDALAALVRHPAFGAWLRAHRWQIPHPGASAFRDDDGWLERLDEFLNERLPLSLENELPAEQGRGGSVAAALRAALLHERLLGGLRGRRMLGEWMAPVLELLLEIFGDGPRSPEVPEERRLLAFARQLRSAAAAHAGVPAELDEECDASTAIRVLLDDLRGEAVPPAADGAAIELLGWLELHLDDAPVAVLTGMNESFVPEAVNADPFLPNALRARLGIEDNDRRYARDAYQLTAMLHSRRVHAIGGRRTMRGDPLRPSRLLLAASGTVLAARIRHFLEDEASAARLALTQPVEPSPAKAAGDAATAAVAAEPGATLSRTRFVLPPEPVLSLPEVPGSFHVTELGELLTDPYGWALSKLLGRDPVADAGRELDPRGFGNLAHAVLERFGNSEAAGWLEESRIAAELERLLAELAAQRFGATLPAVQLQIAQLRLRLRAFARVQAAWLAEGWRTVAVECRTPEGGVPFLVDGEPVRLHGRIDRIDYHAQCNEWAVFDYKTGERGESPDDVHRKKGAWVGLQLPLYRELLPHIVSRDGSRVCTEERPSVRLGYILLCGDPSRVGFNRAEWSEQELTEALRAAEDAVRLVRANRFTFTGLEHGWLDDDLAALLSRGRLLAEADDELEAEVGA